EGLNLAFPKHYTLDDPTGIVIAHTQPGAGVSPVQGHAPRAYFDAVDRGYQLHFLAGVHGFTAVEVARRQRHARDQRPAQRVAEDLVEAFDEAIVQARH